MSREIEALETVFPTGQPVYISLQGDKPSSIQGTMHMIINEGIVIVSGGAKHFVPWTSVLHVRPGAAA